ncbi:MAG: UDP-N-acetylmuramoyl-L-alanine--D-glutamate ligase, partial [Actinomycetota bacterium]
MSGAFAGERAVVVGLGVAGRAAARVLAEEGADVRVSEARPDVGEPVDLRELGIEVLGGGHTPGHLDGATLVVVSPGVPSNAPVIAWARDRGLPVWGELELGAHLVSAPCIAVTGTNGKTTT